MIQRKMIVTEAVLTQQRKRVGERVKAEGTNDRQGDHVHGQGLVPDLGLGLGPVPGTDEGILGLIPDLQDDVEADLGHVPILGGHVGGDHIPVPDADQGAGRILVPDEDQGGLVPVPGVDLEVGLVPIPVPLHRQRERKIV